MKAKIEDIFLAYANHSLIESPKNFHATVDQIDKVFPIPDEIKSSMNRSIELIIRFAKFNDFSAANSYKEKIKKDFDLINLESNFGYVYGYEGGDCYGCCQLGKMDRPKVIENGKFSGPDRLKCFECDQVYFNYVLSSIINNQEYSQIIDFPNFLAEPRNLIKTNVTILKKKTKSPFRSELAKVPYWEPLLVNFIFYAFIQGAVSYSLSEFLLSNDRRKIKRCPHCSIFFIAKDIKRKTRCYSKDCDKAYQRKKKQKQREEDPATYY